MANENMIQKHEDNFLAKIAGGATPVDTNVRNSKEFWLDKIADWTSGKSTDDASTKKIYYHPIQFYNITNGNLNFVLSFVLVDNNSEAVDATNIASRLFGFERISPGAGVYIDKVNSKVAIVAYTYKGSAGQVLFGAYTDGSILNNSNLTLESLLSASGTYVFDGVNAIN